MDMLQLFDALLVLSVLLRCLLFHRLNLVTQRLVLIDQCLLKSTIFMSLLCYLEGRCIDRLLQLLALLL
jgi:hypothetical protein